MCEKVSITHGLGYKLYTTPLDANLIISQPLQASVYLNPMDVRNEWMAMYDKVIYATCTSQSQFFWSYRNVLRLLLS
jgi:hypothetical protein